MKAYVIDKHIELSELPSKLVETDAPKVGKNQILVEVAVSALNFFDILQVQGKYQVKPPHPYVAGCEFAGTVSKDSPIPDGCHFVPGETRIFGAGQGAFAEQMAVDWTQVIEVPEGMSFEEAAGLFITYPTSYAALVYRANLQEGQFLLVHAAAGGVGLAAVQIGKALGAKVIATASTEAKLKVCKDAGADYVINYKNPDWAKEVNKITNGKGANVIYDPVGMINPSLKCIAWNGVILCVGFAAGSIEKVPTNMFLIKNCALVGVHWGRYIREEPDKVIDCWMNLLSMLSERKIRGIVYEKVFQGLESVPEGLRALGSRETYGKVAVKVRTSKQSKI